MNDYRPFYEALNREQRRAVTTTDGVVLVLAGPGTGKTQLLSIRASAILHTQPVAAENILILTYTTAAAKAMRERLGTVIGLEGYAIEAGTFHSFANMIIQESEEAADYIGDRIPMSDIEQVNAIEHILDRAEGIAAIRPFGAPYLYLREILRRIAELKRDTITPEKLDRYIAERMDGTIDEKYADRLKALAIVYRAYEALKKGGAHDIFDERGRYDFDDMILVATEALRHEASLRQRYADAFRYVMVDEYQDTNGAQLDFLFTLLDHRTPNLCCVGDDDQSIFRFQGASVGNFTSLRNRFPGLTEITLEKNYRSTKELIDVSTKIIGMIPPARRAAVKQLEAVQTYPDTAISFSVFTTEAEELLAVVDTVRSLAKAIAQDTQATAAERSKPYNAIAILVRKRNDILAIIDTFLQAGIPYATDGKEDTSGEVRVRQLLDALELAALTPAEAEAKDLALYKLLTADYFGVSLVDILRFVDHVKKLRRETKDESITLLTAFLAYFSGTRKTGRIAFDDPEALSRAHRAVKLLLENAQTKPVHAILTDFIKEAGIYAYLLRTYTDTDILRIRELRAVTSFVTMVKESDLSHPGIRLTEFMTEMRTRRDHGMAIEGSLVTMTQDGVRIFTAHGAKGLEFHSVIIPFCLENKNWPARRIPDRIVLPPDLFANRAAVIERESAKQLYANDETRLFYVAATRAKANLIFTASPTESAIPSSYLVGAGIPEREGSTGADEGSTMAKAIAVTDARDPFIGTESVLRDLIRNLSLNPTRLNTYLLCRRKFLYNDVIRLPGPKKRSLVFGNCVHKALEETYAAYRRSKKFPPFDFFQDAFTRELRFQGVDKTIELQCLNRDRMRILKGWFERASRDPVMPISLEKKLIITLPGDLVFTGKYDKLEWEDEAKELVRIVDYKTGKPDDHLKRIANGADPASDECDPYFRQLIAYSMLFGKDKRTSAGMKARSGALAFIEPVGADMKRLGYAKGDYVTKSIIIDDALVARLETVIADVWDEIRRLRFEKLPTRDEKKCGLCDFDEICWRRS